MNPYEILGVKNTATAAEIKKAYRRASKAHHPDVKGPDGDVQAFREIQESYDVLSDPDLRAEYDRTGRMPKAQPLADQIQAMVLGVYAENLKSAIIQSQGDCSHVQLLQGTRDHFAKKKADHEGNAKMMRKNRAAVEKQQGRISHKKKNGPTIFDDLLADQLRQFDEAIQATAAEIVTIDKCLVYLEDFQEPEAAQEKAEESLGGISLSEWMRRGADRYGFSR